MKAVAAMTALLGFALPALAGELFVPADDVRLSYSDCFKVDFVSVSGAKAARFSRPGQSWGKGYEFDSPGARLRFRTDAPSLTVKLYYNELHTSTTGRNPKGACLIDGKLEPSFSFTTKETKVKRVPETVEVKIKSPASGFHTYELAMPYGDSVDVLGVSVPEGAKFETPAPRPARRCAFYGDSVAHGFTASSIAGTYPFIVSELKGFQMVNLGIGGRPSSAKDAELVASAKCDLVHAHIGTNDWQGGAAPEITKKNILGFIKALRALQPSVPLYIDTSLWVSGAWKPQAAKFPLEDYRKAMRDAVSESGDKNVFIVDGPSLIDHEDKLFDSCLVHPNDKGFAQMAERLAKEIN